MATHLPPLTALRAFEAAARHLSFAEAAAELNVTPAALSFQIKSLEENLGTQVFRRLNRAVELTEAGRTLQPGAAAGFEAISQAWTAARRLTDHRTLTVTAPPGFTSRWLAPRLFAFASAHPGIEPRFAASLRLLDFDRDEIDIAIRFTSQPDERLHHELLFHEWMAPMVTPEIAKKIKTPKDLAGMPLLHQDNVSGMSEPVTWRRWFAAMGLPAPPDTGPHFSQADHAIDAAVAGAGAVLGRASLVEGHLRDNQLVMPFPESLLTGASFYLVCPRTHETRPQLAAFIAWVRTEAESIERLAENRKFLNPW